MSTRSKPHRLCVFMTPLDEARFGDQIRDRLPSVRFVDTTHQAVSPTPTFRSSLPACGGRHVTLVDSSIVSESTFHRDYVVPHPSGRQWIYAMVGTGLASLLRSTPADGGLMNGELRASVPTGDTSTAAYIRELMDLARTGGTGVFAIDPQTKQPQRRRDRNFVAWPDAANQFGQRDTPMLTNGTAAWFVAR